MKLIYDFVSLFSHEKIVNGTLRLTEDLYEAKIVYHINNFSTPNYDDFQRISTSLCGILGSDSLQLNFMIYEKDNVEILNDIADFSAKFFNDFKSNKDEIQTIYDSIIYEDFSLIESNQSLQLEIIINKSMSLKKLNRIYFFDVFIKSIATMDLSQFIINLGNHINTTTNGSVIFLIDKSISPFYSKDIFFIHDDMDLDTLDIPNSPSDTLIEMHKHNCHFINCNITITPHTFKLIKESEDLVIRNLFQRLTTFLSLIFISNNSEIVDNVLKIYINGYKLISEDIDFNNFKLDGNSFFEIFKWVYSDDKVSTKIELARNIISLDYKGHLSDINYKTIASIKSNYIIYSKENVERYIALKNQITESILDLSIKSRDIIDTFSSNFKNAFFANISFIFTVLVLNIVGDTPAVSNVFTRDLTILYLVIVVVSVLYLIFSLIITRDDLNHYDTTFKNLKELYSGLLSKEDLDDTFNNQILVSDKQYIKHRIFIYSLFWILILTISLIALFFLSHYFKIKVCNIIKNYIEAFMEVK